MDYDDSRDREKIKRDSTLPLIKRRGSEIK